MSVYGKFALAAIDAMVAGETLKAMLVDDTYVVNHTHQFRSAITSSEVAGTGYAAGGVALTGVTVTVDTGFGRVVLTSDEIDFGNIAVDCAGIVFYIDNGSAATDVLIGSDTWTSETTSVAVPFTYLPNEDDGIVVAIT